MWGLLQGASIMGVLQMPCGGLPSGCHAADSPNDNSPDLGKLQESRAPINKLAPARLVSTARPNIFK